MGLAAHCGNDKHAGAPDSDHKMNDEDDTKNSWRDRRRLRWGNYLCGMSPVHIRTAFQWPDRSSLSAVTRIDHGGNSWGDLSKTLYMAGWIHFGLIPAIIMKIPNKPLDREGWYSRCRSGGTLGLKLDE